MRVICCPSALFASPLERYDTKSRFRISDAFVSLDMPRCYISLGGNLGVVSDTFQKALSSLGSVTGTTVVAVSSFQRTNPVGQKAGGEFLNAAVEIDTSQSPLDLLDLLQSIEQTLGRTRTVRWGPRPIDVDLLFYGSEIIDVPRLVIPHPAAWYRRFVLDPLVEIAPDYIHPERQADIQTLRARLLMRPLVAIFAGGVSGERHALIQKLAADFPDVKLLELDRTALRCAATGNEPTLTFWLGRVHQQDAGITVEFDELPVSSRLDITRASGPVEEYVRNVFRSALG
jgi:2-amino-4-hydroxy-6-hydroxymethyldihydropteridine diphosphokinase